MTKSGGYGAVLGRLGGLAALALMATTGLAWGRFDRSRLILRNWPDRLHKSHRQDCDDHGHGSLGEGRHILPLRHDRQHGPDDRLSGRCSK